MKVYGDVKESVIILLIVYECSSNRMKPWGEGDTGVEATHYSATLQNSRFSTPSNPSTASSCWLFPEEISLDFSLLSQPSPLSSYHESCPSSGPVISVSTLYYRCLTVSITPSSQAWCKCKHTYLLWMSPQVYNLGCQPSPSTCLKDSLLFISVRTRLTDLPVSEDSLVSTSKFHYSKARHLFVTYMDQSPFFFKKICFSKAMD